MTLSRRPVKRRRVQFPSDRIDLRAFLYEILDYFLAVVDRRPVQERHGLAVSLVDVVAHFDQLLDAGERAVLKGNRVEIRAVGGLSVG